MFILSIIFLVYLLIGCMITLWVIITGDSDTVDDLFGNNRTVTCILGMTFITVSYPYWIYRGYKDARDSTRNIKF